MEETLLKTRQENNYLVIKIARNVVMGIWNVQVLQYQNLETAGVTPIRRLGRQEMAEVNLRAT